MRHHRTHLAVLAAMLCALAGCGGDDGLAPGTQDPAVDDLTRDGAVNEDSLDEDLLEDPVDEDMLGDDS